MELFHSLYDQIRDRRKVVSFTMEEKRIISEIRERLKYGNLDNITRTEAYKAYYQEHSDIQWSFLASMVSRNAGWNMTDLKGSYLPKLLSRTVRNRLFLTYERANWLIFEDAFPQLLLYEKSIQCQRPLFHLLGAFYNSIFIEAEWERYWKEKDRKRLLIALIINEQHVIQKPVIEHPYFQRHVFYSLVFRFQELFRFNSILFPTLDGKLYGFPVTHFIQVSKRIQLGKSLAALLFQPDYYSRFKEFSEQTEHTGSRLDYEQYVKENNECTPFLRDAFPEITHHRHDYNDWFEENKDVEPYFTLTIKEPVNLTSWYMSKQEQLHILALLTFFMPSSFKR